MRYSFGSRVAMFIGVALVAACGSPSGGSSTNADNGASYAGQTNITTMPCSTVGGDCRAAADCSIGAGVVGSADKYECGGSRRVCCLPSCGGVPETSECCNSDGSYGLRAVCKDGAFTCESGFTLMPLGSCAMSSGSAADAGSD